MRLGLETRIAIPLVGGLDTKTDAKAVAATKLTKLENGEFTKRASIRKRPGLVGFSQYLNDSIASGTLSAPLDNAAALGTLNDQLVLFSRSGVHTYHEALDRWAPLGNTPAGQMAPATIRTQPGPFSMREQLFADVAEAGDIVFAAWEEGTTVVIALYTADGAFIDSLTTATGFRHPRWCAVDGALLLLYADTTNNNLVQRRFPISDPRSGLVGAATNVTTALNTSSLFDVRPAAGGGAILVFHSDTPNATLAKVNASGAITLTAIVTATANINSVAVSYHPSVNRELVVVGTATTVEIFLYEGNALTLLNNSIILDEGGGAITTATKVTAGPAGTGHFVALVERSAASNSNYSVNWLVAPNDVVSPTSWGLTNSTRIRHSILSSHAFGEATRGYCWLGYDSTLQSGHYLYAFRPSAVEELVGVALPRRGAGLIARAHLPGVSTDTAGAYVTALGFRRQLKLDTTITANLSTAFFEHKGFERVSVDLASKPRSTDAGQALYITNGMLNTFDGVSVVEAGFHTFPEGIVTANQGAGNLLASAVYNYRVYYEWYNAAGERFRSLAIPIQHTVSGTNQIVRLTIPTLRHTKKLAAGTLPGAAIVVYRTEGNKNVLYYRVTSNNPSATGTNGWVNNVTTADTITFDDNLADASILSRERDYLSDAPTPLFHAAPDSGEFILEAHNRIWLAGGTLGKNVVQFSKIRFDGEPVEFNPGLVLTLPDDGGAITALGQVNNVILAFKRDRIYAITSQSNGPDNTGEGTYSVEHVTSDTGCTSADSVVQVPFGLMFQGAKGIYAIDSGLNVAYIGADIEADNTVAVTAARVIPDTNQVLFLSAADGARMYDYFYKQWSRWTGQYSGVDAVNWRDTDLVFVKANGRVFKRDAAVYTDAGEPYYLRIRTAPIRLQETLQGFYKLRRAHFLGEYTGEHQLTVGLLYDRDLGPFQEFTFDPQAVLSTDVLGGGVLLGDGDVLGGSLSGSEYLFGIKPKRGKFSTIRFDFADIIVGEAGASYEISEILLDCYSLEGAPKLARNRKL